MTETIVGVLGIYHISCGGQLGRMLGASASLLNVPIVILDQGDNSPAKQILAHPKTTHIDGSFSDPTKIRELASKVSILTIEIEHVNVSTLEEIQKEYPNLAIHPDPKTIRTIQNKFIQKQHLAGLGIPVGPFLPVEPTEESIKEAGETFGYPLMLKSRTLAYDGRGNFVLKSPASIPEALAALSNRELYAEKWVPFSKEVAVMVVRTRDGETRSYPAVETVHKDNICHLVFAPLRTSDPTLARRAQEIAEKAVKTFKGAGVFGVELFLLDDGTLYVNEIAPRPHNSGHYTIEGCYTSQYENHLRAILGLPLGNTSLKVPSAAMLNLIGFSSSLSEIDAIVNKAHEIPGATTHLYGKAECRKGRKMGHITITAESDAQISTLLRPLLLTFPASSRTDEELDKYAPLPQEHDDTNSPAHAHSSKNPLVGIIMGSDSDLPTMLPAARILSHFHIPYELTIVSAHRTPDRMVSYARSAASRGLRVIIAGAGGAAHLPGMVAALTALPVVGVPVKGSSLDGVDSLHSIVQMPRGIPVATVAINNSTNAALLAVRMLSTGMPRLVEEMERYMETMEQEVMGKVGRLEEVGWEKYVVKK